MTTMPEHGTSRPLDDSWTPLLKVLSAMITLAPIHVTLQAYTDFDGACGPYVQTLQEDEGDLYMEAVSNAYLDPEIGPDSVNTLLELGWNLPDDDFPNFFRFIPSSDVRPGDVADFLLRTLRDAYLVKPTDTFEFSPDDLSEAILRGDYGSVAIADLRLI